MIAFFAALPALLALYLTGNQRKKHPGAFDLRHLQKAKSPDSIRTKNVIQEKTYKRFY